MGMWDNTIREDRIRHRRENPSFSSTLLDAIYRSIDETNGEGDERLIFYRETTMVKKQSTGLMDKEEEDEAVRFRRACLLEKWMEKNKVSEKSVVRRNSMADFDRKARNVRDRDFKLLNSCSSSSDSSSGGGFSSSESESFHNSRSRSSAYTIQKPKPIKTSASARTEYHQFQVFDKNGEEKSYVSAKNPKSENRSMKTKLKALKIYGDLKKIKQPISPGNRLSSFLNSLFNGGSPKKAKFSTSVSVNNYDDGRTVKSKSSHGSTCSSASSFSRSCLSKTPSSRGNFSNNGSSTKRSVRFCPVSVIVDEDCRPCGQKNLHENEPVLMAITSLKNSITNGNCQEDDDVDDDDAMSDSSSDLFELENLSEIGIERYREELPVYETTHFDTNQAIANGLIL